MQRIISSIYPLKERWYGISCCEIYTYIYIVHDKPAPLPILALACLVQILENTFFQLGLAKCVRTCKIKA